MSTVESLTTEGIQALVAAKTALETPYSGDLTSTNVGDALDELAARPTTQVYSYVFSNGGALVAGSGSHRLYMERTGTITKVRASVGVAPTGAAAIIDVNKNGTTIFTDQSHRPTIAASGFTALASAIDVSSVALGDYLTVDIDQIGSTIAGSNLTVQIEVTA